MATLNYTAAEIDERLAKTDDIGDLTELETTDKDNLVDAVNELFTSVSSGKTLIAAAVTDKGVATAATDSFSTMATNIAAIPTGGTLQTKSVTPTESAQTVTADVGYDGLDEVNVGAISSTYVGTGIARKSSSDLTASGATVTAPAGYYENAASKAVASGSATPASSISATGASVSTGTNTLTLSKSVSNTPSVSAGYVSAGTAGTSSVSLTASVTTKAAATIHPSTSDQSIASGTYLTGAQTVKAVTLSNLSADNIKSGVTVKVGDSSDDDCVASVTGTYEGGGGGGGKAAQISDSIGRTATTTYTSTGVSLTVSKTGTYNVYWSGYRSSTSGTSGTQLYIDGSSYGTAQTTFDGTLTNCQHVHLSNVSLTAGQTITVYARARSTSYYMYAMNLTIIEA